MSNPAVAKWLEEIAAAKAKAQAKEQQQQQQQKRQELTNAPTDGLSQQTQPQPTQLLTSIAPQYGIITSYNLRTRKKQLRLILPPEPHKPGPGECCGNDCEPCVNTIYWEDMAAHRERCRKMQLQYEDECRALLEASEGSGVESRSTVGDGVRKVEVEDAREKEGEDDDGKGLSIRSYRPFKVLQKRYLSENTLVVVCDLPYSPKKMDNPRATNSKAKANVVPTMFHLLIRFQRPDGQYLTKAFTPVDMSRLHTTSKSVSESRSHGGGDVLGVGVGGQEFEDRMAFLVKLYPSPHSTSEMFRDLEVYAESDGDGGGVGNDSNNNNNINNNNRKGVLFLRGPIQTGRDRLKNQQQQQQQQQQLGNNLSPTAGGTRRKPKKRIVMIAAGSGITPMYQVLRALHDQQQKHQHSLGAVPVQEEGGDGEFWEADEVDLVYCNRTTDDIWLRQELQSIGVSHGQEEGGGTEDISEMAAGLSLVKRTAVRLQHVLSSSSSVDQTSIQGRGENHQFHTGRITLDLLRNTLQQQDQSSIGRQEDKEEEQLQILICGPPLFNKDVSAMLTLLEYHDSDTCEIHILE